MKSSGRLNKTNSIRGRQFVDEKSKMGNSVKEAKSEWTIADVAGRICSFHPRSAKFNGSHGKTRSTSVFFFVFVVVAKRLGDVTASIFFMAYRLSLFNFIASICAYFFVVCIFILNSNQCEFKRFYFTFHPIEKVSSFFLNLVVVNNLLSQSQSNALSKDKKQLAIMILIFYHFF